MSHSTHVGFNCPPITRARSGSPPLSEYLAALESVMSHKGRGRPSRWRSDQSRCPPLCSLAVGVGHRIFAATASTNEPLLPFRRNRSAIPSVGATPTHLSAVGVGHHEDPPAEMRRTDGGSRNALPFRVIPERGQVPENVPHSSNKETWDVLHDNPTGS